MKQSWSTLQVGILVAVAAGIAFFGGYQLAGSRTRAGETGPVKGGAPPGAGSESASPAAKDPRAAIEAYAESVLRWKGPFFDQTDQLAARQKLDASRAAAVAHGKAAFDPAVAFLGIAGRLRTDAPATEGGRGDLAIDPLVREAIVDLLPDLDAAKAGPELAARLNNDSEHERVRAKCAGKLSQSDRNVAIPALLKALDVATERAWAGARAILESLTVLGGQEAQDAVVKAFLRPTTSQELRIVAAQAIGQMKIADAVPSLENTIRHEDKDHYIRREALRSLLRIDAARAFDLARDQAERETDAAFREFLKDALKQNNQPGPVQSR